MTRIEVRDGNGTTLLVHEVEHDAKAVKLRTQVSTEDHLAVAWLERDGEILDSIELDMRTQPSGLHRVDTIIEQ